MMADRQFDGESLESLLNKATNPRNREDDWEFIMDFCDRVNTELEGVQVATKLLLYKIRSPQEREALQAITVLEACVKNCGELFQKAVGKSSFVNSILGHICEEHVRKSNSEAVQENLIKLLYIWSVALPEEENIKQAYQKLKHQGIVMVDPVCDPGVIATLEPVKPKPDILSTSDERRKQLEKLLRSKNPHDHKAANLLIKNAVKEDAEKMEMQQKNWATLQEVKNNASLLCEMLAHHKPGSPAQADLDIMKVKLRSSESEKFRTGMNCLLQRIRSAKKKIELYNSCSNFRPVLYRNAASTSDEKTLGDILSTNDYVTKVMKQYEQLTNQKSSPLPDETLESSTEAVSGELSTATVPVSDSTLIDISEMNSETEITSNHNAEVLLTKSTASTSKFSKTATAGNDADDTLLDLRSSPSTLSNNSTCLLDDSVQPYVSTTTNTTDIAQFFDVEKSYSTPQVMNDVDRLQDDFLGLTLSAKPSNSISNAQSCTKDLTTGDVSNPSLIDLNITAEPYSLPISLPPTSQSHCVLDGLNTKSFPQDTSLENVHVPLELIKPSNFPSVTLYDKDNIRVLIYFAKDRASLRADLLVSVISFISTNSKPVRNILLQVAVPKAMKVKLQAASSTDLPVFNPMATTSPVTQIMIIANPTKEEVKLRYKLEYNIDMQPSVFDTGVVGGFPKPEIWGRL